MIDFNAQCPDCSGFGSSGGWRCTRCHGSGQVLSLYSNFRVTFSARGGRFVGVIADPVTGNRIEIEVGSRDAVVLSAVGEPDIVRFCTAASAGLVTGGNTGLMVSGLADDTSVRQETP